MQILTCHLKAYTLSNTISILMPTEGTKPHMNRYSHKQRHLLCTSCFPWKLLACCPFIFCHLHFWYHRLFREPKNIVYALGRQSESRERERETASLVQLSQFGCWSPLGVFEVCLLTRRPTALTSTHEFRFTMLGIVSNRAHIRGMLRERQRESWDAFHK